MKKSKQAGTDFYFALLDWRNTPTEGVGCSPVQRLCGRRTRTLLPTGTSLLKPMTTPGVREKLHKNKERQSYYYNRGTQELSPLCNGDAVVILPSPQARKWKKAQVEDQVDVRSYAVRTEDGRVFRRNRRHLKKYDVPPATHTPWFYTFRARLYFYTLCKHRNVFLLSLSWSDFLWVGPLRIPDDPTQFRCIGHACKCHSLGSWAVKFYLKYNYKFHFNARLQQVVLM